MVRNKKFFDNEGGPAALALQKNGHPVFRTPACRLAAVLVLVLIAVLVVILILVLILIAVLVLVLILVVVLVIHDSLPPFFVTALPLP